MGELYPPTAADYAYSNAQDALNLIKALTTRVRVIELQIESNNKLILRLLEKVDL